MIEPMDQEHPDLAGDSVRSAGEKLMAIGYLFDAIIRRNVTMQMKAAERDRILAADRQRLAEIVKEYPLINVVGAWRMSVDLPNDKRSAAVRTVTEHELAERWPALMNRYREAQQQGLGPQQAMSWAAMRSAEDTVFTARPNLWEPYRRYRDAGLDPGEALRRAAKDSLATPMGAVPNPTPAGQFIPPQQQALPAPQRQLASVPAWLPEVQRVADQLDSQGQQQWLEHLRSSGTDPQIVAWCATEMAKAAQDHARAERAAGQPDDPATVVDEHTRGLRTEQRLDARAAGEVKLANNIATGTAPAVIRTPGADPASTVAAARQPNSPYRWVKMAFPRRPPGATTDTATGRVLHGDVLKAGHVVKPAGRRGR